MPNVNAVLKQEMLRVARKEIRSQLSAMRKAMTTHRQAATGFRREISELKKTIAVLRRSVSRSATAFNANGDDAADRATSRRFSARGMAAHRKRLGFSASEYGKLIGVTGQSIYNWEAGSSRPKGKHLETIAVTRALGKRAAASKLEALAQK